MAIRKYNRPPARPLGRSLAQHFTTRSKKEVFSLDGPGSTSMATWFLGPKAENQVWFENLVLRALRSHAQSRLNYCPTDPPYVTPEIRNTAAFKDGKLLLENALDALLDELKGCVPFYSHRWQGHMNWDTTLPGLVGLIATLPYNPNNVAAEASPFRPQVLPDPRWSHCTTVKYFSQLRKAAYAHGLIASPGPPCRKSNTGLLRSSPRIVTHCWIPPIST